MRKLFLLFILILPCSLGAQSLSGRIIEEVGSQGIGFVNIGVLNQSTGTVSTENGHFELSTRNVQATDTIRFSAIGYATSDWKLTELRAALERGPIVMEKKAYVLEEIRVVPKDYKRKRLGNFITNKAISAGFMNNNLGHELGTKMKMKKGEAQLESITINFAVCDYDSIFYRLNVYSMDRRLPSENLLNEPIYLNLSGDEALKGIKLDVRPYQIWVEDDFFVSLELVKDLGEGNLNFTAGFFAAKTYYRETSQAKWEVAPVSLGIGIGATVLQEQ
jgi:hypothetical protein